jgi:hypothetical protein
MRRLIPSLSIAFVGAAVLFALGPAGTATAAPAQTTLHLDGTHPADADRHEGTFTASSPLCTSGSWLGNGAGHRVFTCADGTGTFTASFNGELEHVAGLTGPWAISRGTGNYTALRGAGTGTIDSSTGENVSRITFAETWSGIADFDATPPTGSVNAVKIVRPATPAGRWIVKVSLGARDNEPSNAVTFGATASAGTFYTSRAGTINAGTGSFTIAFRPAKRTRLLQLEIVLSDRWNNQSTIKRSIRLR